MESAGKPVVARLAESEKILFGPDAHYHKLVGGGGMPIFTGIQTSQPGYATPVHSHPYVEMLFVIEGTAEAWLEGHEDEAVRLEAGDMCALPPNRPHGYRTVGDKPMRVLGIHCSPTREVSFADGSATGENGYQVLDERLQPVRR
jgi:quercetin dioxygenase-like cupin family protein